MTMRKMTVLLVALALVVPASVAISKKCGCDGKPVFIGEKQHHAVKIRGIDEDGAWLGVHVQELNAGLREAIGMGDEEGVLVADVEEDSPAEKAGIESGDVILEIDKKKTPNYKKLVTITRKHDPGDEVEVIVLRDGKKKTFKAKLAESDRVAAWAVAPDALKDVYMLNLSDGAFLGGSTMDLENEDLAGYLDVKASGGALVTTPGRMRKRELKPACGARTREGILANDSTGR